MTSGKKLLILTLAIVFIAGLAADGFGRADARFINGQNRAYTYVYCYSREAGDLGGPYRDFCFDAQTPPTAAYCNRAVDCRYSKARGIAYANRPFFYINDFAWAFLGSSYAKDRDTLQLPDFKSIDSVRVNISDVKDGQMNLQMDGDIRSVPGCRTSVKLKITQNDDSTDVIFEGDLYLIGAELTVSGGFESGSFEVIEDEDTSIVSCIYDTNIDYIGSFDDIGVDLIGITDFKTQVPSLTPYGLLILVALLVLTGLWLYRKKRFSTS